MRQQHFPMLFRLVFHFSMLIVHGCGTVYQSWSLLMAKNIHHIPDLHPHSPWQPVAWKISWVQLSTNSAEESSRVNILGTHDGNGKFWGKKWENHRKTIGKSWFSRDFLWDNLPLVDIAAENVYQKDPPGHGLKETDGSLISVMELFIGFIWGTWDIYCEWNFSIGISSGVRWTSGQGLLEYVVVACRCSNSFREAVKEGGEQLAKSCCHCSHPR